MYIGGLAQAKKMHDFFQACINLNNMRDCLLILDIDLRFITDGSSSSPSLMVQDCLSQCSCKLFGLAEGSN